jgi:hypothetical protein
VLIAGRCWLIGGQTVNADSSDPRQLPKMSLLILRFRLNLISRSRLFCPFSRFARLRQLWRTTFRPARRSLARAQARVALGCWRADYNDARHTRNLDGGRLPSLPPPLHPTSSRRSPAQQGNPNAQERTQRWIKLGGDVTRAEGSLKVSGSIAQISSHKFVQLRMQNDAKWRNC